MIGLVVGVVAVINIVHWREMGGVVVAMSALWLGLLAMAFLALRGSIRNAGGLDAWLIEFRAPLFERHFMRIGPDDEGDLFVRLEYDAHDGRRVVQCAPLRKVRMVEWNPGQGTGMGGRDMNDWDVHLRIRGPVKRVEEHIMLIGQRNLTAAEAETLGQRVVRLLQRQGVVLEEVSEGPNAPQRGRRFIRRW
jgi:hypothetical protein